MKHARFVLTVLVVLLLMGPTLFAQSGVTKYVRYSHQGAVSYGVLDGETIRQLRGSIFENPQPTGVTVGLADVKLLTPVEPRKVICVGLNYASHLNGRPSPPEPGLFTKYPTSLIATGENIVFPEGAGNVHYEGEMVLVIGKGGSNIPRSEAMSHLFGVTAGNDISERDWQANDLQWFRAKASDTFGPIGPALVTGLDPDALHLETRLNGEVRQSQSTGDLVHDVAAIVSYISRFVTLEVGDIIFTGTPGATRAMEPGDVVEIELEGVGILHNTVAGSSRNNN